MLLLQLLFCRTLLISLFQIHWKFPQALYLGGFRYFVCDLKKKKKSNNQQLCPYRSMGSHACFEARTKKTLHQKKKYTESTYKHRKKYLYIFIYIITIPGNGRQVCTKNTKLRSGKRNNIKPKQTNQLKKISRMKMPNRTCAAIRVHEQAGNKKMDLFCLYSLWEGQRVRQA